jgi:transcriptional regulator with XRE-family HTH domain
MTQGERWVEALHGRIADAIRDAREGKMTAQQLADETERLGYPMSRSQIANYESGRKRSLEIGELFVLAAALKVAPLELLFPGTPDQPVEILPDETTSTLDASTWFIGTPDWLAALRDQLATLTGALTTRTSLSARDIRMGETQ